MGVDKVLMFVRSIDRKEMISIRIELEDDDGANGFIEDWAKFERVCQRHDEKRMRKLSATTWPMSGSQKRFTRNGRLPPIEESSLWKDPMVHNIEALIREAYEILKMQVDTEGKPKTEPKSRQTKDEEEAASQRLRTNNVVNTKTEVRCDGTTGEGLEQAILSPCEETTAKDKAND